MHEMELPALTHAEYRAATANLPRPTPEQMEDFAKFVSGAHSWYKHLPMLPPGVPFLFYLDPSAGMQRKKSPSGSIEVHERHEKGSHYSWIPTKEYRRRFGYLAFSTSAGRSVFQVSDEGAVLGPSDNAPLVYVPERARLARLPDTVIRAGTAWVSGIVHTMGSDPAMWVRALWPYHVYGSRRFFRRKRLPPNPLDLPRWPEKSGGDETLRAIINRVRVVYERPSRKEKIPTDDLRLREDVKLYAVDARLYDLLSPERKRQQSEMVHAMRRMLEVTSPSGA